ncbi:hypothetical protein VNO77_22980 [Canavalia gladiata]|uniref:Uncharacterized protein n=1 Tax=Canavalia gladiata TaxID=3824 RepID=A0AAN9L716_CANGL
MFISGAANRGIPYKDPNSRSKLMGLEVGYALTRMESDCHVRKLTIRDPYFMHALVSAMLSDHDRLKADVRRIIVLLQFHPSIISQVTFRGVNPCMNKGQAMLPREGLDIDLSASHRSPITTIVRVAMYPNSGAATWKNSNPCKSWHNRLLGRYDRGADWYLRPLLKGGAPSLLIGPYLNKAEAALAGGRRA